MCSSVARYVFGMHRPWVLISALAPKGKKVLAPVPEEKELKKQDNNMQPLHRTGLTSYKAQHIVSR